MSLDNAGYKLPTNLFLDIKNKKDVKLLDYIKSLIIARRGSDTKEAIAYLRNNTRMFCNRYNENLILCKRTYEEYINSVDLQRVVQGIHLDPDRFWLLILYCFDKTIDLCLKGVELDELPREIIGNIVNVMKGFCGGAANNDEKTCVLTLKCGCESYDISNTMVINVIANALERTWMNWNNNPELKRLATAALSEKLSANNHFNLTSRSVAIWYYANLLIDFFVANPQFKGRASKGSGLSFNRIAMISRIIYNIGLSDSKSMLYNGDSLKGFLGQYKGKRLRRIGRFYGNSE